MPPNRDNDQDVMRKTLTELDLPYVGFAVQSTKEKLNEQKENSYCI